MARSDKCILGYPSGQKQPPKRDIIIKQGNIFKFWGKLFMAFMVARTEKRKVGSLAGYQNHVDRKTENHSNKEIDKSKTFLNYDLVGHEISTTFHHEFMDYIKENRVGSRAVRKDAVVMQDWLIGSSQEFFDELSESEIRRYFETAVEFFAEKFGRENIRFATVHMDEKTPHMHMGIVTCTWALCHSKMGN